MAKVVMYATAVCPYCVRAEQLLRRKGVAEIEKIRIDLDSAQREIMMQITGRRTVPQIFINEAHVGGCDDLYALEHEGRLDALLAGTGA
ncbi:glutaredoxin 3 [Niveibacterium umoris]|uniref:Glutaredoxin n=1 Tax=Niveibacterium umoris TaxID=1193620 RepID=A0A840BM46_9RHOO|nr:glutaredoxin 3 [Niveibacterium umoris]MBB4014621.1 glutaredoxin 3 [Niveibacterium umoris]